MARQESLRKIDGLRGREPRQLIFLQKTGKFQAVCQALRLSRRVVSAPHNEEDGAIPVNGDDAADQCEASLVGPLDVVYF